MRCNYLKKLNQIIVECNQDNNSNFEFGIDCLVVGHTYPEYIGKPDGRNFYADQNGLALHCNLYHPMPQEVNEFQYGNLKFALAKDNEIMFFLSKFGNDGWSSSTNNFSLNPEICNELSVENNGLSMLLFDSSNGKLVAIRTIGLHHEFMKELIGRIKEQSKNYCSVENFSNKVRATYRKYPTDNALL